jgi:hypothetical protein
MTDIRPLDLLDMAFGLPDLIHLLREVVADGASIGFVLPLSHQEALQYWLGIMDDLRHKTRLILGAYQEEKLVGSVQLGLEKRANSQHRAEVQKLLVHPSARRQGIGRQLMIALEAQARAAERFLLVLDTRSGDPASQLYTQLGYITVGSIPGYARDPDSATLSATVIMYKQLEAQTNAG